MIEEPQDEPAPAEEAEPAPATDETSVATVPPEQTIPKSRFDEVYRHRREAERDRDYWRELAMRSNPQPEPQKVEPAAFPQPEQFGFDDAKYQAAVVDYNKQIARSEAASFMREERQREQHDQKAKTFRQREADFSAKNADYRDKVYDQSLPLSAATVELIAESEDGPAIALFLANNRELAQQIYDLPPVLAARELGRIEARMTQQKEAPPAPKPVLTKAPPPPPKIEASDGAISVRPTDPESDKEMSDSEWMRSREKQLRRKTGNK
jgi:hypothetical protein